MDFKSIDRSIQGGVVHRCVNQVRKCDLYLQGQKDPVPHIILYGLINEILWRKPHLQEEVDK